MLVNFNPTTGEISNSMLPLAIGMGAKAAGGLINTIAGSIGAHHDRVQRDEHFKKALAQQLEMQGNQFAHNAQMQQNQFNQQKFMASNAIQLRMGDMAAAGINPLLAAGNANFSSGGSNTVQHQPTGPSKEPSRGAFPKVVNAKKLYILK